MGFENIIGNKDLHEMLKNSISSTCLLHSYLFVGIEGIGKCLTAKEFARLILNDNDDDKNNLELINHPDFMFITPDDGKSIKIDQIRLLQEKILEKPIVSSKKVYVIDNADVMTKESQNCLLKTLEDPPEYAVIILVTSNENKLLTTIKSRCTKLYFLPLSQNDLLTYFTVNHLDKPSDNLLKLSCGSISKAIQMQNEKETYENIDFIFENIEKNDILEVWQNSNIIYQSKNIIFDLLEYINLILFNRIKETNDLRYANCIYITEQTKQRLLSNANFDMCIDNLLLKIWEEFHEEYSWS